MRLREKGKKDGEIITLGWDEAQAALQAGTHEVAEGGDGDGGPGAREPAGDAGAGGQDGDNFDALTRQELDALAAERGIDVSKAKTKADVIEALRAAR